MEKKWVEILPQNISRQKVMIQARGGDVEWMPVQKDKACPEEKDLGFIMEEDARPIWLKNSFQKIFAKASTENAVICVLEDIY